MTCIKTGAHVYLEQYNEWAYGDMHAFSENAPGEYDVYAFSVAQRAMVQPIYPVKHFTIHKVLADWRDQPYGTILASSVTNHGYEGVPI